jgi:hypothetical protein
MELNHCAFRVYRKDFEMVISFFTEKLGFKVLRRKGAVIWMRQGEATVDIQLSASDTKPETQNLDIDRLRGKDHRELCDKSRSQIAFLSEQPEKELQQLAAEIEKKGYKTIVLGYSEKEFFLDIPEVFIDFVIEAMTPECAEYDT